jgi:hypothetical protein
MFYLSTPNSSGKSVMMSTSALAAVGDDKRVDNVSRWAGLYLSRKEGDGKLDIRKLWTGFRAAVKLV